MKMKKINFYCWKGIHFSFSLDLVLLIFFFGLVITFHFWFRDLLREKLKKYEILLMVLFLGFLIFLVSEALLFISFILAWTFISLQIKEFRVMGLFINDSVYSSVFFFLTGLHFFHLVVGLFLLSLFFWGW